MTKIVSYTDNIIVCFPRKIIAMGKEDDFFAAVGSIYEAVLDASVWPAALNRLADAIGAAQVCFGALDRHTGAIQKLSPRQDPFPQESYKDYWAFHDPFFPLIRAQKPGELCRLGRLATRDAFATSAFYNDWCLKAEIGLSTITANLRAEDQFSATIFAVNPPGREPAGGEQMLELASALPHFERAMRIHRELRLRDLNHDTAPGQLEQLAQGVMLVDSAAKVLFANRWARALAGSASGLTVRAGRVESANGSGALRRLIASCAPNYRAPDGPGGQIVLRQEERGSLRVTVTPLRARGCPGSASSCRSPSSRSAIRPLTLEAAGGRRCRNG